MNTTNGNGAPKIGVYICHCGINIASKVDIDELVTFARGLPLVAVAREYKFMCSDPGQELIQQDIRDGKVNRVVVASCSPLMHESTFRQTTADAGENPFLFQMANIREHVSWVTLDKTAATRKSMALVAAAVHRVALHVPLEIHKVPVHPDVMVVGGGIAGIQAALTMANADKKVYLVEREPTIGGHMAQFDKTFPTLDCSACILTPKMTQVRSHPNIELLSYSEVEQVDGYVGNFQVKVRKKSRLIHEDICNGCAECAEVCPVELDSEFDAGLGPRKAVYRPFPQAVPNSFTISRLGTPPCSASCSIHQNAQAYLALIAQRKYAEALTVILRDNPLPSVCGRVCTHPCTVGCNRNQLDEALDIPGLKRFVMDWVKSNNGDYALPMSAEERPEKVAIVGSGPAGLMCAFELRQHGYQADVFEALPVAGGMLAAGIPAFRLPRHILEDDIRKLEEIGITIRLNSPVGENGFSLDRLNKEYDAVFVGIGAHKERQLNVPGEKLRGVHGGIEFLWKINQGEALSLGKRVLIIGGGNSALDAARTVARAGAEEVRIVYRRTRSEMPADQDEIDAAIEEGVQIDYLTAPLEFLGDKRVSGLRCQRMKLGPPDKSGRPRPLPIEGSEFDIQCDAVITTIGQVPNVEALGKNLGLALSRWGTLEADSLTLETDLPGVFAGGDCVTGPDVVVQAMGAGRKAAISIHRYLNGLDLRADRQLEGPFEATFEIDVTGEPVKRRVPMPEIGLARRHSFDEIHTGYTEEQAVEEACRCLNCAICSDCHLCSEVCEPKAIDYTMQDEVLDLNVGTIVLATGFKTFEPERIPQYGYGKYPNVYTSLEVERLVNASGPTSGELVLRDGGTPGAVGIIHCVGSRDHNTNAYCSKVCCMYSLKLAHLIKERTGAEVYNFYIDMRSAGKGYEEFYDRLLEEGNHFIRGRVADVTDWAMTDDEAGKLVIRAEDTLIGVVRRIPVDMVVLAVGMEPQSDSEDVRRLFNISCSNDGWFLERHPKLAPVSTFTDGVFLAGACQAPKDIPDSVAQAGAAASEALALMDHGFVELEPNIAYITEEDCSGCKTCIPLCPYTAISLDAAGGKALINEALCKGCGTCVAACPSGSARQQLFSDEQIFAEIEGVLSYV